MTGNGNERLTVLRVDSSMRHNGSASRDLTDEVLAKLQTENANLEVTTRDLADGIPFVDEAWVGANFTDPAERTADQRAVLAQSDALVAELKAADILVLGAPMYNFNIPAALKAWIDLIARARETFQYTADGPVGLLEGKKAVVVLVSGGTEVGGEFDFASDYLRHVLGFVGIHDVEIVSAGRLMMDRESAVAAAREQIGQLAAA